MNHEGRRLVAVVLDTTINNDHRAWEQAQMLLHEAYGVRSGVDTLKPLEEEPTPATTQAAPTPAPDAGEETAWNRWMPYAIVAGVLALAALATALSLATATRPRRRR